MEKLPPLSMMLPDPSQVEQDLILDLASLNAHPGMARLRILCSKAIQAYFAMCVRSEKITKDMALGYETGVNEILTTIGMAAEYAEDQLKQDQAGPRPLDLEGVKAVIGSQRDSSSTIRESPQDLWGIGGGDISD